MPITQPGQNYLLWLQRRGQRYPLLRATQAEPVASSPPAAAAVAITRRVLFISAAPLGDDEAALLFKMIHAMGLNDGDVLILPTLPAAGYAAELLIALGPAAFKLLPTQQQPGQAWVRGQLLPCQSVAPACLATFHPRHLLQQPQDKRQAWSDLQVAMSCLGLARPPH